MPDAFQPRLKNRLVAEGLGKLKEKSTLIRRTSVLMIIPTTSSDEHFNGDCDHGVVEVTPALVERGRKRIALIEHLRAQDRDVYEVYFWGTANEFYGYDLAEELQNEAPEQAHRFDSGEYAVWHGKCEQS